MRVALDTNRLTDYLRGDVKLAMMLERCTAVLVPLPVIAEIKIGFLGGNQPRRNESLLRQFLAKPTVEILLPDGETAEHYANLFVQLKRAGTPIPVNDIWIAALALQHNLALVTRDGHFNRLPQLMLERPETP